MVKTKEVLFTSKDYLRISLILMSKALAFYTSLVMIAFVLALILKVYPIMLLFGGLLILWILSTLGNVWKNVKTIGDLKRSWEIDNEALSIFVENKDPDQVKLSQILRVYRRFNKYYFFHADPSQIIFPPIPVTAFHSREDQEQFERILIDKGLFR
ncbi:MAG: hypothetical protein BroJett018_03950 [Chloroflexota bacterium]|nr:hypothetical protein [Chloroflexota bacterium]NOG61810.1 hypothetical protein [Chloroflexota bacterium]GIK62601.1 MAG: hypothetical protein BroJett018_03950 [Chloroflexota bacterium]